MKQNIFFELFQTTKIQTFESNSQPNIAVFASSSVLFQTTKIQTFESNSQRISIHRYVEQRCSRLQRYKLLKAIHNERAEGKPQPLVVPDYKDTNF